MFGGLVQMRMVDSFVPFVSLKNGSTLYRNAWSHLQRRDEANMGSRRSGSGCLIVLHVARNNPPHAQFVFVCACAGVLFSFPVICC